MSGIVEKVITGDVRTVARLIRDIDDGVPEARDILKELYGHTGRAYVIGITGAPGVGKSTLTDHLVTHLRRQEKTVGVLAVDPTSPFSGGAILGDRVRMQRHSLDEGVFIRSLATRGSFGGMSQSTRGAILVLDAMGKDFIIVETVGVGQDEVDVAKNAHTTVIVLMPGMGDDIQALKAGILEVGDVFVINKADRDGADKTLTELRQMIERGQVKHNESGWKPPIIKTEAVVAKGVAELLSEIEKHRKFLAKLDSDEGRQRKRDRMEQELSELVKTRLIMKVFERFKEDTKFEEAVEAILDGRTDPYTACDELIRSSLASDGGQHVK